MLFRLLTLLVFFMAIPLTSRADVPSFEINFSFNPPMTVTPATPMTFLDICANPGCLALNGSVGLTCPVIMNPMSQVQSLLAVHCNLRVVPTPGNPTMMMLANPVYLRLRSGNLVSPPFYFSGAQSTMPATIIRYRVTPSPTGFSVTAR